METGLPQDEKMINSQASKTPAEPQPWMADALSVSDSFALLLWHFIHSEGVLCKVCLCSPQRETSGNALSATIIVAKYVTLQRQTQQEGKRDLGEVTVIYNSRLIVYVSGKSINYIHGGNSWTSFWPEGKKLHGSTQPISSLLSCVSVCVVLNLVAGSTAEPS